MFRYVTCALLTPAVAWAAAFSWTIPEPTFVAPAVDRWSPAPTRAPNHDAIELFKRQDDSNTCGFISGISSSAVTCYNSNYVCATNTYYGVHGCCDPTDMSACSIPTTCIPSSLMSASCTDSACSSDGYIAKCTGTTEPNCYEWSYVYPKTTMIEYGCAAEATTAVIPRTMGSDMPVSGTASAGGSGPSQTTETTTVASASATAMPATTQGSKPNNTGAIVGGAVGGLVVLGAIITGIVFLVLRDRRQKRKEATAAHASRPVNGLGPAPGVTEYNPYPMSPETAYLHQQHKGWNGKAFGQPGEDRGSIPMGVDCAGNNVLYGVVETQGTPIHEAPSHY